MKTFWNTNLSIKLPSLLGGLFSLALMIFGIYEQNHFAALGFVFFMTMALTLSIATMAPEYASEPKAAPQHLPDLSRSDLSQNSRRSA